MLVSDKPPWLGPRLLQRILDHAAQSDKEARENQRTCEAWMKSLRNFKVTGIRFFCSLLPSFDNVIYTEIETLVSRRKSVCLIFPLGHFISKFVQLLFESSANIAYNLLHQLEWTIMFRFV